MLEHCLSIPKHPHLQSILYCIEWMGVRYRLYTVYSVLYHVDHALAAGSAAGAQCHEQAIVKAQVYAIIYNTLQGKNQ